MAIINVDCKKCGAPLKIDSSKEYGYCEHCGNKVQLHDIVSVKHSGSVHMDYSKQATNWGRLADIDFTAGKYSMAAERYAKVLEVDADNYVALYRYAICVIYLTYKDTPDIKGFISYMGAAKQTLDSYSTQLGQSKPDLQREKDIDIEKMILCLYDSVKEKYPIQPFADDCVRYYKLWLAYIHLAQKAVPYIDTEKSGEVVLARSVDFCIMISKKRMSYKCTVKDRDGKDVENVINYVLSSDEKEEIESARKGFAEAYNALPSRVKQKQEYECAISSLNEEISQLKKSVLEKKKNRKSVRAGYWKANPEMKAVRQKQVKPGIVVMISLLLIGMVMFFVMGDWAGTGIVVMIAGVCIGIKMIMSNIEYCDKSIVPESIQGLDMALNDEKTQLKKKKDELGKLLESQRKFKSSLK